MARVFSEEVAREIAVALSDIEAKPGRGLIWTITTQSENPQIGHGDHAGLLRELADDAITIATDPGGAGGDREIGWYEIVAIRVAPDPDYA